jgi:archaellum component FlaC
MNDRELLEFVAAQVGGLTQQVGGLTQQVGGLTKQVGDLNQKVDEIDKRVGNIEKIVTGIESNHGQKLEALFDAYKQHTDILERVEKEVSKQEEIIMRRVK